MLYFIGSEIRLRKQLNYPPFCDIIVFGISGVEEGQVQQVANKLYQQLQQSLEKTQIAAKLLKPLPAPINKIKNRYRWRMIIKGKADSNIIQLIHACLNTCYQDSTAKKTRIIVDINPTNMM